VLVPLDGSQAAEDAVEPLLASLGQVMHEVELLHVVVPPRGEAGAMFTDLPAEIDRARASLERVAERLRGAGWSVHVQVVTGHVAASIANVATNECVDMIAMATHGYSGLARLVLGSIATETLQRATVPVVVLRPSNLKHAEAIGESSSADQEVQPYTVLVALDLSERADAALEPTARLAQASDARVVLVNVIRPLTDLGHVVAEREAALRYVRDERRLFLQEKERQLTGLDVHARVEVLEHGEEIAQRVAAVAAETGADVVVVVSKRVSSPAGVILGSVAQGIVGLSPCPVLIISPSVASADPLQRAALTA
jgi:nucleotide-binding universal stress UspA family protein